MGLYLENGYLNVEWILSQNLAFNFIVGGRGTGKTYGFLSNTLDSKKKFIFMRRTKEQVDIISTDEFSPFKRINLDRNIYITTKNISKSNKGFYNTEKTEDGAYEAVGEAIGYICSLSTISNMRGFDASDCELLIYDEFIPERHERPIKNEGTAFLNAYETINRNRELEGKRPLQVIALSNSNTLANAIFMELGIVKIVENMINKDHETYINRDKSLGIFSLSHSPISERKKDTAIYKVSKDTSFYDMSLGNEFVADDFTNIISKNLKNYNPIVAVGELCIYQHKSEYQYYVCGHYSGKPVTYNSSELDRMRFKRAYLWLWNEYLNGSVYFEEFIYKAIFEKYFTTNY